MLGVSCRNFPFFKVFVCLFGFFFTNWLLFIDVDKIWVSRPTVPDYQLTNLVRGWNQNRQNFYKHINKKDILDPTNFRIKMLI